MCDDKKSSTYICSALLLLRLSHSSLPSSLLCRSPHFCAISRHVCSLSLFARPQAYRISHETHSHAPELLPYHQLRAEIRAHERALPPTRAITHQEWHQIKHPHRRLHRIACAPTRTRMRKVITCLSDEVLVSTFTRLPRQNCTRHRARCARCAR